MTSHSKRPLSPHLQIYRPQITSILSITHRMTGTAMALGSFIIIAWLWGLAYDSDYFNWWQDLGRSWFARIILIAWSFALFYHLSNGIRHLFWDMGKGFDLKNVTRSGIAVLVSASILTAALWLSICNMA